MHCLALDVVTTCPYQLQGPLGIVDFAGYLPFFGGVNGLLICELLPPKYIPSEKHRIAANSSDIFISFVNPLSIIDRNDFIEALLDWGYFGKSDSAVKFTKDVDC